VRARNALLSVSEKRGIEKLAADLVALGFRLVSTGGTARALKASGLPVTEVSDLTGSPEVLDGRVKTLHPRVFAAILANLDEPDHRAVLADWGLEPFSVVVVNLYPFTATAAKPSVSETELIENIDIGGPSLLRAAAKNHRHVTVVVDPDDYPRVATALGEAGEQLGLRRELAIKAFRHTAAYDATIAATLPHHLDTPPSLLLDALAPWVGATETSLRYGENPHQSAVLALPASPRGFAAFRQLQGKELSYNNLVDADGAWQLAADLPSTGVVIVKHAAPCCVGLGATPAQAYERALACDPVSAFGGVIASSMSVDGEAAAKMAELFAEVIVAPGYDEAALATLARKKNLRVLEAPAAVGGAVRLKVIDGGLLIQTADSGWDEEWKTVTERAPSEQEMTALRLAWRVAKHTPSNAIVVATPEATVGIGGGQPSRVDSCRIAIEKAGRFGLDLHGTAVGSDAFFPFPDGPELLAAAGVTALAQPGGSMRDAEVIAAANRLGVAMVFTGRRHFRH
jgi:phosphoribosylaminoimidazolecarboxamide formyltransferase / IMP cyclohydrolase